MRNWQENDAAHIHMHWTFYWTRNNDKKCVLFLFPVGYCYALSVCLLLFLSLLILKSSASVCIQLNIFLWFCLLNLMEGNRPHAVEYCKLPKNVV